LAIGNQKNRYEIKQSVMKVIIEIPDNHAVFGIKVLNSLSFAKKAKPMSDAAVKLWEDMNEAAEQVRLHKEGKIKLKSAHDLLNEL
jgi:hypothetical protein